jgi:broad specificity phosphatase PhoE
MRILFVRHGKSIANATGMVGTPDTPLSEVGLEQARITGQDLRGQNVTRVVCSPFRRAQQTAEIIAGELGITLDQITVIPDLYERRMGTFEGNPKQCETAYFYENDKENEFESQAELISRLKRALDQITEIAKNTNGTTVAVGHATSGFYFLQVARGKETYKEFDSINQMGNAEFVEVELATRA